MKKKRKHYYYYFEYFFCYSVGFFAAALLLFLIFHKENISFVRMTDGVAQHFAVLKYYRRCLLQILHGNFQFPMVDFSIGQGFDLIGTLNYYGVGDPINLLTVCFSEKYLEEMYAFLILMRMYLSGVSIFIYCRTAGIKKRSAVLSGAWLYAFCGFVLLGGMKHPIFLSGMLYLPLLAAGTERVIQKKSLRFLAAAVALAFMSNYYFMYMNTVLCGIYILIRWFGSYRNETKKGFFLLIGKMILAWLWGICLSAVVLFPAVYAFLHNSRGTVSEEWKVCYNLAHYRKLFLSFFLCLPTTNGWTVPATAVGGLAGLLLLFTKRKGSKEEKQLKVGFLILFLMLCIPAAGKVMNGFAYTTNRWSYAMAFLCAFAATWSLAKMQEQNRKHFMMLTLVFASAAVFAAGSYGKIVYLSVAVFVATAIVFCIVITLERKQKKKLASCLLVFAVLSGVCWNLISFFTPVGFHYAKRFQKQGKTQERLIAGTKELKEITAVDQDGFYRSELPDSILNRAVSEGIQGTAFYYSVIPENMKKLYASLGFPGYVRSFVFSGLERRQSLLNLSCVRYVVDKKEKCVLTDEEALPIGYTYDQAISLEAYQQLSLLERQAALLQYAVLDETGERILKEQKNYDFCETPVLEDMVCEEKIENMDCQKVTYKNGKIKAVRGGKIKLSFDAKDDMEYYLLLHGLTKKSNVSEKKRKHILTVSTADGKKEIQFAAKSSQEDMQRAVIAVKLGNKSKKDVVLRFCKKGKYRLEKMEIQGIAKGKIRKLTDERRKESMTDVEVKTNAISGKLTLSKNKILQIAVPYSKGWSLYVDGKKAKVFPSGIAYMGTALEKGEHFIEMRYCSPYLPEGVILTVFSGILWIVTFANGKKRKGKTYE